MNGVTAVPRYTPPCQVILNPARFAWSGLRAYHNVDWVAEQITTREAVPSTYSKDVKKQAEQIRYCLIQANEYHDAAKATTYAIRPLLLYYSAMSFALAEILWKQDGRSSLDMARASHSHHGLELVVRGDPKRGALSNAELLVAKPHANKTGRMGTFELWHRTSRIGPLYGRTERFVPSGGSVRTVRPLLSPLDQRPQLVPTTGISLLDCLQLAPALIDLLHDFEGLSRLVRGRVAERVIETSAAESRRTMTLTVHPGIPDNINRIRATIDFLLDEGSVNLDQRVVEGAALREMPSGFILDWPPDEVQISLPDGFCSDPDNFHFVGDRPYLNEFGVYYVALFITGMFSRYYPDFWMRQLERRSHLALAIESLIDEAERRLPVLTLSEFTGRQYLEEN